MNFAEVKAAISVKRHEAVLSKSNFSFLNETDYCGLIMSESQAVRSDVSLTENLTICLHMYRQKRRFMLSSLAKFTYELP